TFTYRGRGYHYDPKSNGSGDHSPPLFPGRGRGQCGGAGFLRPGGAGPTGGACGDSYCTVGYSRVASGLVGDRGSCPRGRGGIRGGWAQGFGRGFQRQHHNSESSHMNVSQI
ncbi:unnamed protein product, partial [Protopolystoma xenopodis]